MDMIRLDGQGLQALSLLFASLSNRTFLLPVMWLYHQYQQHIAFNENQYVSMLDVKTGQLQKYVPSDLQEQNVECALQAIRWR